MRVSRNTKSQSGRGKSESCTAETKRPFGSPFPKHMRQPNVSPYNNTLQIMYFDSTIQQISTAFYKNICPPPSPPTTTIAPTTTTTTTTNQHTHTHVSTYQFFRQAIILGGQGHFIGRRFASLTIGNGRWWLRRCGGCGFGRVVMLILAVVAVAAAVVCSRATPMVQRR